jgi:hypothetical protein
MSLGEDMMNLSLGDGEYSMDPILLASVEGRHPTLKDVKKSLKVWERIDALRAHL